MNTKRVARVLICGSVLLLLSYVSSATTIASVKIEDLFRQADLVAIVKIVSGTQEGYPEAVYRAQIVTAFKGGKSGDVIYFGPFVGYKIGWEYLVFLKKADTIAPLHESASLSYGPIAERFRVMYDGFSTMELGYECVFSGKDTNEKCDYSVVFNPEQIKVPASLKLAPSEDPGPITNYKKWARKTDMIDLLRVIQSVVEK